MAYAHLQQLQKEHIQANLARWAQRAVPYPIGESACSVPSCMCMCMCVFVPLLCSIDKGVFAVRKFERMKLSSSKVEKKLWRLRTSLGQMQTKSTGHTRGWWTK